jgi:hypothetical protein
VSFRQAVTVVTAALLSGSAATVVTVVTAALLSGSAATVVTAALLSGCTA